MSESGIVARIRVRLGLREDLRLFRNNVAQGVVGTVVNWIKTRKLIWVNPGDAVVRNARVLHAGLHKGSPDLVGLKTIVITQEMVGRRIAVFVGLEAKDERGCVSEDQRIFLQMLQDMGALAGVAQSADDATAIVDAPPGI